MANLGALMHCDELRGPIVYVFLPKTAIEYKEAAAGDQGEWRTPILNYINHGHLPEDKALARKLRAQESKFCIIGGILIKRSISNPFLNCIPSLEVAIVLKELHEGSVGNHSVGKV